MRPIRHYWILAVLLLVCAGFSAQADISVWLDFANFSTRLDELAAYATVDPFTALEQTLIKSTLQSQLNTIYSGFDVSFTETLPTGDHENVRFGATTTNRGLLGQAQEIDWLNLNLNDSASIYSTNFDFTIDEFSGSVDRAAQLSQLTTALAGTAAHELGHNLGLQHPDAYGDRRLTPSTYSNTHGWQNEHIMATGGDYGTGLGETGRETARTFNTLETAKLEYADGLTASPGPTYLEPGAVHNTPASALSLLFTYLPLSDVNGFSMYGSLGAVGEYDFFSFTGQRNEMFTANTISQVRFLNPIDSFLTLYASDGTTVLASNDDIAFGGNTFNGGTSYSDDSILLNYLLQNDDTYYLQVRDYSTDTGNYALLTILDDSRVPEPSTLVLVGIGLAGAGIRLRRRKKLNEA